LWAIWRRVALVTIIGLAVVSASYAAYCGVLRYLGNFHVVEEGLFYRSAQLDETGFERVIKDHAIRSILNLRGAAKGPWYHDEVEISKALGVEHYDYHLHSDRIVTPQQIYEILKIIRAAPKPILVHCSAGSDRAGLVSALYLFGVDGSSPNAAAMQLSLLYGHFPYLTSKTGAMDQSFWGYVQSGRQLRNR
jgi:protein tyrosine/serine phosphatase